MEKSCPMPDVTARQPPQVGAKRQSRHSSGQTRYFCAYRLSYMFKKDSSNALPIWAGKTPSRFPRESSPCAPSPTDARPDTAPSALRSRRGHFLELLRSSHDAPPWRFTSPACPGSCLGLPSDCRFLFGQQRTHFTSSTVRFGAVFGLFIRRCPPARARTPQPRAKHRAPDAFCSRD